MGITDPTYLPRTTAQSSWDGRLKHNCLGRPRNFEQWTSYQLMCPHVRTPMGREYTHRDSRRHVAAAPQNAPKMII